jgi:hypothetical protein
MPKNTMGKTGTAPIKKVGHTASGRYGDDPQMKVRGGTGVRDISPK